MKKRGLLSLALAAALLCGCTGADGKIYGQGKVLDYVDSVCTEPYELVGTELVAEEPDDMRYDFVTRERGLAFTAHSYLAAITIDATVTSWYTRKISCDYVSRVHDLYREDIGAALAKGKTWLPEPEWMYAVTFADLDNITDTLLAADAIYSAELAYNPPEFLAEHPAATVHLVWQRSEAEALEHKTWVNLTDVSLTGQQDRQTLYDRLAGVYAQAVVDKKVEDGSVPAAYLAGKHRSRLDALELNGTPLAYDTEDNPYNPFGLITDDFLGAWYSYGADSYLLAMDIGYMSDGSSFPLIAREYALALGGSYTRETDEKGRSDSSWTIGGDTWRMRSTYRDGKVLDFTVEKNGQPLDLTWYTVDQESEVGATFCVGLPAEDFCRLFGLGYEADEDAGCLRFYTA